MILNLKIKGHWTTVEVSNLVREEDNFLNDTDAADGGIEVGALYHTDGVVKIRLTDNESPEA